MLNGIEHKDLDAERYEAAVSSLYLLSKNYKSAFKEEPTLLQKLFCCLPCGKSEEETKKAITYKVSLIKSDLYIATYIKATNPKVETAVDEIDKLTLEDVIGICVHNVKKLNKILLGKKMQGIDYKEILDTVLSFDFKTETQITNKSTLRKFSDELKDGIAKLAKQIEVDIIKPLEKRLAPTLEKMGKDLGGINTKVKALFQKKKQ